MDQVISLDEFRKNLSEIVGQVMYGNKSVFVKKHNKRGVVVMSEEEYDSLKDPKKRFNIKKDSDKFFVLADKVRERMSEQDQEELDRIIDQEVQAVRNNMKHEK